MRSLATGIYSHDEVAARLAESSYPFGTKFEVLSSSLAVERQLQDAVRDATVDMNVDRVVKGSLAMRMIPDLELVNQLFRKRIKVWWRLGMPDGGIAEFPMGVYIWNVPTRDLASLRVEEWAVTLGDQCHILDAGGPGPVGFTALAGERITDAIKRAVQLIGFTDTTGILDSPKLVGQQTTWGLRDDRGRISWMRVLTDLHGSVGYYSPWFDGNGRYRATPVPDLRTEVAGWSYEPGQFSLLQNAKADQELDAIGNRVFVVASNQGAVFGTATADANAIVPGHRLSQGSIGFYIDKVIDDQVASTIVDLELRARNELLQSLSTYRRATIGTLFNPSHEAFDIVRLAWPDDYEWDAGANWHERVWTGDLFAPTMTHELRRLD